MKKYIFLTLVVMLFAGAFYYWVEKEAFRSAASPSNVTEQFEIKEGEGSTEVGISLEKAGLVKNKYIFYYYVWRTKTSSKLQVGIYELSPGMTMPEMVAKFTKGDIVPQIVKLTIPEGFTNRKIVERLKEKKPELAEEFERIVSCKCINQAICGCDVFSKQFDFLQALPNGVDMEGYLFPDTYFIEKDDTAEILVAKFLNNFEKQVNTDLLKEIQAQGKSLHEVLTMASIVEREVRTEEERKIVAGIFWRRIKDDHPLQSDATLSYFMGVDKIKYSNNEVLTDSPYNTYVKKGLPPGPVSNPGLVSVRATIYPEATDYYFFLTDANTGEVVYSVTGEEHEAKKSQHGL